MVKRLVMLLATAGTAIGVMGSEPLDYQQVVQFIEEHCSVGTSWLNGAALARDGSRRRLDPSSPRCLDS